MGFLRVVGGVDFFGAKDGNPGGFILDYPHEDLYISFPLAPSVIKIIKRDKGSYMSLHVLFVGG